MKNHPGSYTENYSYTSKDADYQSLIKPSALINYFIQIAWMHAEKLEMGYSHLLEENKAWVLSRFTLELNHIPDWPGEMSITTWPKRQDRLFYLRDAILWDANEKEMGRITSHWLVIDINTKRPKLLSNAAEEKYLNKDAIQISTPTLKPIQNEDLRMDYTVRYNDIDINHHLTTVRYLELLWDTFDLDFIQQKSLKKLHVNFIREIKYGTALTVKRKMENVKHFFEICDRENDFVYFRAEMSLETA